MSTARVSNHRAVPDPNAARAASTQTDAPTTNQRVPVRPRLSPPSYNPQRAGDDDTGISSSTGTGSSRQTPRPATDNAPAAWASRSGAKPETLAIEAIPSAATSTDDGASPAAPLATPRPATDNVPTAWAKPSGEKPEAPVTKAVPSAATNTANGTSQAGPVAHSAHVREVRDVANAQHTPSIQDHADPHEPNPVERARTSDLKNQERLVAMAKLANTGRPKIASANQLELLKHSADLSLFDSEKRDAYAARADNILNLPPSQQTLEVQRWQGEVAADAKAVLDDPSKRATAAFHMPTGAELFPQETAEGHSELHEAHAKYIDPSSSAQAKQEALEEAMQVKEQMQATIAQQFDTLNETATRQWNESQERVRSILDTAEHKFNADNLQIKHSDDPEWDAERVKAYAKTYPYQYVGERLLSRDGLSSQERSFPYAWRNDRHGEQRTDEQMATDLLTFQEAMNNPASDIHKRVKALEDQAFSAFSTPRNENTDQVSKPQRYSDVIDHNYQDGPDYVSDLAARYAGAVGGIDHQSRLMLRQTSPFDETWQKAQYGMGMILNSFMPPGMDMLAQGLLDATVPNQGGLTQQEQNYINLAAMATQFIPLPGRSPGSRTGASPKVRTAPTRTPSGEPGGSRPSAASGSNPTLRPITLGAGPSRPSSSTPSEHESSIFMRAGPSRPHPSTPSDNESSIFQGAGPSPRPSTPSDNESSIFQGAGPSSPRSSTPSDSEGLLRIFAIDQTMKYDLQGNRLQTIHGALGYSSNYRNKGADALVLHGRLSDDGVGMLTYQRGARVIELRATQDPGKPDQRVLEDFSENYTLGAERIVMKLRQDFQINLRSQHLGGPADPNRPIYLIACYATAGGDRSPAQQLANATGREVRAYSDYQVTSFGISVVHGNKDILSVTRNNPANPWYQQLYVRVRQFFQGTPLPALVHKVFRPQYVRAEDV